MSFSRSMRSKPIFLSSPLPKYYLYLTCNLFCSMVSILSGAAFLLPTTFYHGFPFTESQNSIWIGTYENFKSLFGPVVFFFFNKILGTISHTLIYPIGIELTLCVASEQYSPGFFSEEISPFFFLFISVIFFVLISFKL